MKVLFVSNQGGPSVVQLTSEIAKAWRSKSAANTPHFAVWYEREALAVSNAIEFSTIIQSFEGFLKTEQNNWRRHVKRLSSTYETNWSAVIASERSFVDASFLLGGAGERRETLDYVTQLTVNIVRFFESLFETDNFDAVFCYTPDSFFTHVLFKVCRHYNKPMLVLTPLGLGENGEVSYCITDDEYCHSRSMESRYIALSNRELNAEEAARAERFRENVTTFDIQRAVRHSLGTNFVVGPLSPNILKLPTYLYANWRSDKNINYQRFDVLPKIKANFLRLWRRWRTKRLLGPEKPQNEKYVLFPLHYQPEQSTLVGGIYYTNQIVLAEQLASSLPVGWSLVIKEHPKGRGSRPAWQYRHLAALPNIEWCDGPTKSLLQKSAAVVTITGTVAIEAMAFDVPTVLLGKCLFDFPEFLFKPEGPEKFAEIFRKILVEKEYHKNTGRKGQIDRFFFAYLSELRPGFPSINLTSDIATALSNKLNSKLTCQP